MDSPIPATPPDKPSPFAVLQQQNLKSYTCTFSPRCVVSIYFAIALLFIPIGSAILAGNQKIRGLARQEYSNIEQCQVNSDAEPSTCIIKFTLNETIPAPSYLYYSLKNFHQNARKYAKSRSDIMNQGDVPKALFDVQNCDPYLYKDPETGGDNGFDVSEFIYPCGLTARSFFNDTFELFRDKQLDDIVTNSSENIAWLTDRRYKFGAGPVDVFGEEANANLTNEDFMVWMRLSAFPNFDKLHRIITEDLVEGSTYYMRIGPNFPVSSFGGAKGFHITTVQWFGARNPFLGTAYLVTGVSALIIAIILLAKHVVSPKSPTIIDPAILLREKIEALTEYNQKQVIPPQ